MDIQNIFSNGLPQELKNLQDGQIYLFPKFGEGLSEKNILISQYINAAYKKIIELTKGSKKKAVVFAIPTENQALWDCIACRITTSNGEVIEVADSGSLLEMLFDYYGVDYANASKVKMSDRHKIVPANYPPERIPVESTRKPTVGEDIEYDWSTSSMSDPYNMSIGCLLAEPNTKTKDGRKALKEKQQSLAQQLEDILWVIRYYDFPIDPKEIMEKVEQHSQDKEEDFELSFDFGTINEYTGQLSKCDIYVSPCKDAVPLNIKPIFKATYLAVMLMKDGINPSKPSKEFIGLVRYIYEMLPTNGKAQDDDNGIVNDKKKFDSDWVGKQLNGIRNAVKEQIPNLLIAQKFAVEGYRSKPFTVQKADDSIRKQIRKAFLLN